MATVMLVESSVLSTCVPGCTHVTCVLVDHAVDRHIRETELTTTVGVV
jgi:hypothetical protein